MVVDAYSGTAEIVHLDNPRVEEHEHYYRAAHTKLLDLGLVPHLLNSRTLTSLLSVVERHRDRVQLEAIEPTVAWRSTASVLRTSGAVRSESWAEAETSDA
jgi:UDP-sulfoquinovose synthase